MGKKCSCGEEIKPALAAFWSLFTISAFRKMACSGGNGSPKEEAEFPNVVLQVALVTQLHNQYAKCQMQSVQMVIWRQKNQNKAGFFC